MEAGGRCTEHHWEAACRAVADYTAKGSIYSNESGLPKVLLCKKFVFRPNAHHWNGSQLILGAPVWVAWSEKPIGAWTWKAFMVKMCASMKARMQMVDALVEKRLINYSKKWDPEKTPVKGDWVVVGKPHPYAGLEGRLCNILKFEHEQRPHVEYGIVQMLNGNACGVRIEMEFLAAIPQPDSG